MTVGGGARHAAGDDDARHLTGDDDARHAAGGPADVAARAFEEAVCEAARLLKGADRVCVTTGAGMSAESGVATFRDADGLWSKFNPAELATVDAFRRDPLKVWQWYRLRRSKLAAVEPHEGHRVLARMESAVRSCVIVTQNVDGLHHRAGSRSIIELHGRLDVVKCSACDYARQTLEDLGEDPMCPQCARRLRPGVVWFGESLPEGAFESAVAAVRSCDVLLVIGTSGVVQPAASLIDYARGGGAKAIEINPQPTPLSDLCDVCIRGGCRDALMAVERAMAKVA